MRKFGVALGFAFVMVWSSSLRAAPAVGPVLATPSLILTATPTTLTITASIPDPTVIAASVNVQRVDATGRVLAVLGPLRDDGTQGDVTAGDSVYTGRVTLTPTAPGRVYLRVSAGFRGMLRRVLSEVVAIGVAEPGPAVQAAGPSGGTFAFPNGILLDIPPGALAELVPLAVTALGCDSVDPILSETYSSRRRRCLGAFSAQPDGLVFASPIKVSLPVSPLNSGEIPLLGVVDLPAQSFTTLPATVLYLDQPGVVEVDLRHFTDAVITAEDRAAAAAATAANRACQTCSGYTNPACEEFYPPTPEFPPCCQVPAKNRETCSAAQSCECCMEKRVRTVSTTIDNSNGDCQMLNVELEVTYLDCPNKQPRKEKPAQEASGCPLDMTYTVTINGPDPNPMFICSEYKYLTATMSGVSKDGKTTLAPAMVQPKWEGGQPGVLEVNQATGVVNAFQTPVPMPGVDIFAVVSREKPEAIGKQSIAIQRYPPMTITASSSSVAVGEDIQLTASIPFACGPCKDVHWNVAGSGQAVVDADGKLTGVSAGGVSVMAETDYCGQHFSAVTSVNVTPARITVKAKIAGCDWGAPYCYFAPLSVPVDVTVLVSWPDGRPVEKAQVYLSGYLSTVVMTPSAGQTDSQGLFHAKATGATPYVPYYTVSAHAVFGGGIYFTATNPAAAAISDDICDADSSKIFEEPPYVQHGSSGYISFGICSEVGKTCVDGSGYVDGRNGACDERERGEVVIKRGSWWDKVLIIPQDKKYLGSIFEVDVSLENQQVAQGNAYVTFGPGLPQATDDKLTFYFNSPGMGASVTLGDGYEALLGVGITMANIYSETGECLGSTGGSSSVSLSASRRWTLGDVRSIDRSTGVATTIPYWAFSCSGAFTTSR